MGYQWNWGVLFALSPDGGQTYLQTLLDGLAVTVQTAALAWALALGLGIAVGVARTLPYPLVKRLAGVYSGGVSQHPLDCPDVPLVFRVA